LDVFWSLRVAFEIAVHPTFSSATSLAAGAVALGSLSQTLPITSLVEEQTFGPVDPMIAINKEKKNRKKELKSISGVLTKRIRNLVADSSPPRGYR
jgi:hypothetical protein